MSSERRKGGRRGGGLVMEGWRQDKGRRGNVKEEEGGAHTQEIVQCTMYR